MQGSKRVVPVGVQVSGAGQLGEPVIAQGVCAAQVEMRARTRLAVRVLSIMVVGGTWVTTAGSECDVTELS